MSEDWTIDDKRIRLAFRVLATAGRCVSGMEKHQLRAIGFHGTRPTADEAVEWCAGIVSDALTHLMRTVESLKGDGK